MNITKKLQENITTWCETLRSGECKQGEEGRLQDGKGGYCCLGVGCVLFIPEDQRYYDCAEEYMPQGMPDEQPFAPKWLKGIDDDFCRRTKRHLYELNDGACQDFGFERFTFDEIADLLEAVYIHKVLA